MGNFNSRCLNGPLEVVELLFGVRFRRVNADDHDLVPRQFVVPGLVDRQVVNAIDASERPKVQDHDFAAKIG